MKFAAPIVVLGTLAGFVVAQVPVSPVGPGSSALPSSLSSEFPPGPVSITSTTDTTLPSTIDTVTSEPVATPVPTDTDTTTDITPSVPGSIVPTETLTSTSESTSISTPIETTTESTISSSTAPTTTSTITSSSSSSSSSTSSSPATTSSGAAAVGARVDYALGALGMVAAFFLGISYLRTQYLRSTFNVQQRELPWRVNLIIRTENRGTMSTSSGVSFGVMFDI
ncbi:hypothetical protein SISNIDRAFT_496953 [Sistotremastrum niveocremeum HHB9708]|uniref:REJ domain-containing protein n=1 Tax=Sistotremastrum niveocremeum HHB9708 TaxID=1314777 RepID=A0A164RA68_9AGAM|nr:hypothetical protein SISNIDRAFT_496953 [Sistotremastrum niveocremeum HHB9708]